MALLCVARRVRASSPRGSFLRAGWRHLATGADYSAITITDHGDGVHELCMNQGKANSLNSALLGNMSDFLRQANQSAEVNVLVLTGANQFFCAGADVKEGVQVPSDKSPVGVCMHDFINFDKPIIAAVNGPAVGGGVTMLAHCDYVFAASHATFWCPFSELGIAPEFCSSLLLPHIMGHQWAHRVLVEGAKLTAEQAKQAGLIGEVVAPEEVLQRAVAHARILSTRPSAHKMLPRVKQLMRKHTFPKSLLHEVCTEELELLDERLLSGETKLPHAK